MTRRKCDQYAVQAISNRLREIDVELRNVKRITDSLLENLGVARFVVEGLERQVDKGHKPEV